LGGKREVRQDDNKPLSVVIKDVKEARRLSKRSPRSKDETSTMEIEHIGAGIGLGVQNDFNQASATTGIIGEVYGGPEGRCGRRNGGCR
jgi:hypothetical protein